MMATENVQPVRRLDVDVSNIVAQLAEYNVRIVELSGYAEELKAELRGMLTDGEYVNPDGTPALRIVPTRRFDVAQGMALVPEGMRESCLSLSIDAGKVKDHLTPLQVDACMVESGRAKVTVL